MWPRNITPHLEVGGKLIGLLLLVSYGVGFIVWNIHLSIYGYFEYDLLQTRFLSSGLLTLLIFAAPLFVLSPIVKKLPGTVLVLFLFLVFSAYLLVFSHFFFHKIPQHMGGAQPFAKWIIADPSEIEFLRNFNIPPEDNGDRPAVETKPVCEIYSNKDNVVIGTIGEAGHKRVLILDKEHIKGYQAAPPTQEDFLRETKCSEFFYTLSNIIPQHHFFFPREITAP